VQEMQKGMVMEHINALHVELVLEVEVVEEVRQLVMRGGHFGNGKKEDRTSERMIEVVGVGGTNLLLAVAI